MSLARWFLLIGLLVAAGSATVTQRTALFLGGYAVGERQARAHARETDVSWLTARVDRLTSPTHLASVASERQLHLVAWSTLPSGARSSASTMARGAGEGVRTLAQLSDDGDRASPGGDTAD